MRVSVSLRGEKMVPTYESLSYGQVDHTPRRDPYVREVLKTLYTEQLENSIISELGVEGHPRLGRKQPLD